MYVERELYLPDAEATMQFAQHCAKHARKGDSLWLQGELGAGKSTFARAFIQALCPDELDIPSPTFTLVQQYDAPEFEIHHFDLYRLSDISEAQELGFPEVLDSAVTLIEWPDRIAEYARGRDINLFFTYRETGRSLRLSVPASHSAWLEPSL